MRNLVHLAVIAFCVVLGLLVITVTDYWAGAVQWNEVQQQQIMHGRIESWAQSRTTWSRFPTLVPLTRAKVLYDLQALYLTVPLFLAAYYTLRIKGKHSLLTVGVACLGLGAIPYAVGRLALLYNTDITNSGPWVAVMLMGILYATAACFFFALLGLLFTNVNKGKTAASSQVKQRKAMAASL